MSKKNIYPEKTTLNLVIKDRPPHYYRSVFIVTLAIIIIIGVFMKLAVLDRLSATERLQSEARLKWERYEALVEDNEVFAEVRAEYEKYFKTVNEDGPGFDCMDVLALIEQTLMTRASVQSAGLTDNTLSVVLTGINLEQASGIVRELYLNELVSSAGISSADTTVEGTYSSISMSIVLVAENGEVR